MSEIDDFREWCVDKSKGKWGKDLGSALIDLFINEFKESQAARAQQAGSGEAVAWDSPAVDPIVTKLYRRFKEWSQRGFTADDVTWCEVRKDVADMLNAARPQPAQQGSVPERLTLEKLRDQDMGFPHEDHEAIYMDGWNECIESMLAAGTPHPAPSVPEHPRNNNLLDKEKMLSAIESFRDRHYPPDGSDFSTGYRRAVKEIVGMAMEGRFAATPQTADNWIEILDLTLEDADERGHVWGLDCDGEVTLECANDLKAGFHAHVTHFMPTGLKRPNPPEEGAE